MKYVSGGLYRGEFYLVRPYGKVALPYVTSNPTGSLWGSIKYHSHMYRVEPDGWLYLEKESWDAEYLGVEAPATHKLSPDELAEVEQSLKRYDYK